MIRAQVLASIRYLETVPDPFPPPLTWLCYAWAFAHVREYVWAVHALVLNILVHTTLLWIQFMYHSYIGKFIGCEIFRQYNGSFGSLLDHFTCLFEGAWPSFSASTYYCCFLEMLGSNHSYICHLFPIGWSHYYSWYNDTCWYWQFSFLVDIMKYLNFITLGCPFLSPFLWKFCGIFRIFTYRLFGQIAYTSKSVPHF
jgi:hypothetical protein